MDEASGQPMGKGSGTATDERSGQATTDGGREVEDEEGGTVERLVQGRDALDEQGAINPLQNLICCDCNNCVTNENPNGKWIDIRTFKKHHRLKKQNLNEGSRDAIHGSDRPNLDEDGGVAINEGGANDVGEDVRVPMDEGNPSTVDEGGTATVDEEGSAATLDEGISMDARAHVDESSGDEGDWNEFIGDEGGAAMDETSGDEGGPLLDEEFGVPRDEQGQFDKMKGLMQAKLIEIQKLCDSHGCSQSMQGDLLHMLFSGLRYNNDHLQPWERTFGDVFRAMPMTWKGEVAGGTVPSSWKELMTIYKKLGMIEPKRWRMCVGNVDNVHDPIIFSPSLEDGCSRMSDKLCNCLSPNRVMKRNCHRCSDKCTECQTLRKDIIAFDYLSIIEQLRLLMTSRTYCERMLAMWRDNERWIGKEEKWEPLYVKEFWDGEKLRAYQDFWNPSSLWELPVRYPTTGCSMAYRAFPEALRHEKLQSSWNGETYEFDCSQCNQHVSGKRVLIRGDPRNIALSSHWDGFVISENKERSTWVVEIGILNARTSDPVMLLPVLFIPRVPGTRDTAASWALDKKVKKAAIAFLKPFVEELEQVFCEGFKVHYNYPSSNISNLISETQEGDTIQAILMLVTRDHPAQSKLCMFKQSGKCACRRCKMHSTLVNRIDSLEQNRTKHEYVYDQNLRQALVVPQQRSSQELFESLCMWKSKPEGIQKKQFSMNTGISGESPFWRFYHLYGLDMSRDFVFDVMHVAGLNIFKNYNLQLFNEIRLTGCTSDVEVISDAVEKARPHELKSGRWPYRPVETHTGYKAEEHKLFVQWILPLVLKKCKGRISNGMYQMGLLLVDIAHYFFNYTRQLGWRTEEVKYARDVFKHWRVISESTFGPNGRPLEHVAGTGHLLDDIKRFGHSDVYWCFVHEREVQKYLNISKNSKGVEKTFIVFYARKLLQEVQRCIGLEGDNLYIHQRALVKVHSHLVFPQGHVGDDPHDRITCHEEHRNCTLSCNNIGDATELYRLLQKAPNSACANALREKGIMFGRLDPSNLKIMESYLKIYLQVYLQWSEERTIFADTSIKRIMF
jgi:hypothetical protein